MKLVAIIIGFALTLGVAVLIPWLSRPPDRFTVGLRLIEDDRADEAATLFRDPIWIGIAEYRAGRFRRAVVGFSAEENALALYNLGNAHARLHEWAGAKAAYRRVLHLDPSHSDAQHNLELVEQAEELEKQQLDEAAGQQNEGGWRDAEETEETVTKADKELRKKNEPAEKPGSKDQNHGLAKETSDKAGESDLPGLPGEQALSDDGQRGIGVDPADDDGAAEFPSSADTAVIRRESEQAAQILLRQIRDDPKRVLSARLRSVHRSRRALEGSCTDC